MELLITRFLIYPLASAKLASRKGRKTVGWAFTTLLLGPPGLLDPCGAGDKIQRDALLKLVAVQKAE